jgi:hypothetical protein
MHEYKNSAALTKAAVAALSVFMALELAEAISRVYDYRTADTGLDGLDAQTPGIAGIVSILSFAALIVCFILVGCWIYRASANAHSFSDEMTISPGGAVGWYFVPIACLFKPYQAMREIWMASHYRGHWHGEPTPGLLAGWWALWIVSGMIGYLALRFDMMDGDGQMLEMTTMLDVGASLLNVPLSLVMIAIIRSIARAQAYAPLDETFA